jgi:hypothetical protein
MKLIISACLVFSSLLGIPSALALNIINQYPIAGTTNYITVNAQLPSNPTNPANQNTKGSCKSAISGNIMSFRLYNNTNNPYSWSSGITDEPAKAYLCFELQLSKSSSWIKTYTNPLADVNTCTLEVANLSSTNELYALATPDCKYAGLCKDGTAYAASNQNCCPTGHWKDNKCSANPV